MCDAARSRYNNSFKSSIFESQPERQTPAFVPAGKRRDQTTSEMFGNYDEKDLRAMPKTFVPKDDGLTARQMKLQFLSSEVLPCNAYPPATAPERSPRPRAEDPALADPYGEDEAVDTRQRRHNELSSGLFGRKSPESAQEPAYGRSHRLTPNDFSWHSHPEHVRPQTASGEVSHSERAYQEKCSSVFGHQSPDMRRAVAQRQQADRYEEDVADMKRRANAHYSDLFGRSTPMEDPEPSRDAPVRRPKLHASHEDQIIVHQDWTDSKTELMSGARGNRPEHPQLRKSDELHQTRVFGGNECSGWHPPERLEAVTHDNSHKLKKAFGQTPQQIHQAHMRTSITPDDFYHEAESTKQWEVVELHVSGLPSDAHDEHLRRLCQGFDLQLVKVAVDMDPVRNLCKGRGKILVRHNAQRDSVKGLVRKLQDSRLNVEV